MLPLLPLPLAAVAPDDWSSVWAGAQGLPVHESRSGTGTGAQFPAAQPELGLLILTAKRHLLLGGSLHCAPSSWARKSSPSQLTISDTLLCGLRARVGFRIDIWPGFGVMGSLEPGFDLLPFVLSESPRTDIGVLPELGSSLTPFFEIDRVRVFAGVSFTTIPSVRDTVVLGGLFQNGAPEPFYTLQVAIVGGARINLTDSIALGAAATVPLNREKPPLLPMFSVNVHYQQKRESDRQAEARRLAEPRDPPSDEPASRPPAVEPR